MSADRITDQYQMIGLGPVPLTDVLSTMLIGAAEIPPPEERVCHALIAEETLVLCAACSSNGFTKLDLTGQVIILGELLVLPDPAIWAGGFTALLNAT